MCTSLLEDVRAFLDGCLPQDDQTLLVCETGSRSGAECVIRAHGDPSPMTKRPTLIFDGDCGFCRTWVEYWKSLTGDRVEYLSIEQSRRRFPDLFIEDLRKRVHLVTAERVYAGAEAVIRSLADVPGYGWLLWLYRFVPGFAEVAELLYGLVSRNRGAAMTVTRALWGDRVVRSEYTIAALTFTRLLSFVYLIALASVGMQVRGLIGSEGILPVGAFFDAARAQLGYNAPWRLPSLFWWANTDFALLSIAWGGVAIAAVSVIAKPWGQWQRTIFAILFLYYLSFVSAGQVFMGYQWDYLLLEAGFLAIFLRPERRRVWLFQWLLFRLMFESGVVKLTSRRSSWHNLTALNVHFETQPLPTLDRLVRASGAGLDAQGRRGGDVRDRAGAAVFYLWAAADEAACGHRDSRCCRS